MIYYKYLLIFTLIFLPSISLGEESISVKKRRVEIKNVIQKHIDKIMVSETEKEKDEETVAPDNSGVCKKCKGLKYIVQGDGHKTPCPLCTNLGDQIIEEKKATIYFYSSDNCDLCEKWKAEELPGLLDYNVVEINETTSVRKKFGKYPAYELKIGNYTVQYIGYLNKKVVGDIYDKYKK
jgi:hypothetical protein